MNHKHLSLVWLTFAATGCVTQGPLVFEPPSAGTPSAGQSAPSPADGLTGAASRIAQAFSVSPTPVAAGARGTAGQAPQPSPGGASLQMGNKRVEVSSVELDPLCKRVVAPFDLADNVQQLAGLAADGFGTMAAGSLGSSIGQALGQPVARAPAANVQRHKISAEVRQAAVRMNWLPMVVERQWGEYQHKLMGQTVLARNARGAAADYAVADRMLREVLATIDEPHGYEFSIHIRTRADGNAMALPGGLLYLDSDLVKPAQQAKGYFALAHEIAHVLQRHETRIVQARIVDAISLRGGVQDLIKTIRDVQQANSTVIATILGTKLLFEQHYAGQELQSDACAVRLLDRAFTDRGRLEAAVSAFVQSLPPDSQIAAPTGSKNSAEALADLVDLVSRPTDRHPGTAERRKNLVAVMAEVKRQPAVRR